MLILFIAYQKKKKKQVSKLDNEASVESFEDALEEYFEWMGIYLHKLWDNLAFIRKRMDQLSSKPDYSVAQTDLQQFKSLINSIDQAEVSVHKFLESCSEVLGVSEESFKVLMSQNNVLERIIKIRRLQKLLEEKYLKSVTLT